MATRDEAVRLRLIDAGFSTGMAKAAAETAALDAALDRLDGSNVDVQRSTRSVGDETERTTRTTKEYTLEMAVAEERSKRFKAALRDQAKAAVDAEQGIDALGDDVDTLGSRTRRAGNDIDTFSGRLGILAEVAAVLGPSLVPIGAVAVPAITGLANQMAGAAVGAGSLIVAFQGVGDALEAVNEAALEPTAENIEAAQDAMAAIGPEAREFVTRFQELRPVLTDIRDAAAAGWFPGLTEALDDIERIAPNLERIFMAVGDVGGGLVDDLGDWLAGGEGFEFLTFLEREAPRALETLGRTVGNLAGGLAEMWMAFQPLNNDFSDWLLGVSRDFNQWSQELSESEGFREFVQYIRESGPQVADAFSALGSAIVAVVEAVAPLGGPSLKIIETFANAVEAIAESDLGTPFIAAMGALSLYNRGLKTALALQGALGLTGGTAAAGARTTRGGTVARTAGAKGPGAFSKFATLAAPVAAGEIADLAADPFLTSAQEKFDLPGLQANLSQAATGGRLEGGLENLKADIRNATSLSGDISEIFDETIGTLGGALGDTFRDEAQNRIKGIDAALTSMVASGNAEKAAAALEELGLSGSEIAEHFPNYKAAVEQVGEAVESTISPAREAADAERERAAALSASAQAALGAFSATTAYREALKEARKQAKDNSAGIDGMSQAALDNRGALEQLAGSYNNLSRNARSNVKRSREMRDSFIDTATAMGVPEERAIRLANRLMDIPARVRTKLEAEDAASAKVSAVQRLVDKYGMTKAEARALLDDAASGKINSVQQLINRFGVSKGEAQALLKDLASGKLHAILGLLNSVDGRNTQSVHTHITRNIIENQRRYKPMPGEPGAADGGTILGQRQPYGDKVPMLLAPGEEVISNRFGQADKHRDLLKAINANRYADGGTVGRSVPMPRATQQRMHVTFGDAKVVGSVDTPWGPAQVEGVARAVARQEIDADAAWRHDQGF